MEVECWSQLHSGHILDKANMLARAHDVQIFRLRQLLPVSTPIPLVNMKNIQVTCGVHVICLAVICELAMRNLCETIWKKYLAMPQCRMQDSASSS